MTDQRTDPLDDYGLRIGRELYRLGARASEPHDAVAIARAAATASTHLDGRRTMAGWLRRASARPAILVALLIALVLAMAVLVGQQPSQSAAFVPGSIAYLLDGVAYVGDPDGGAAAAMSTGEPGENVGPVVAFAPDRRHFAALWTSVAEARLVISAPDGVVTGTVTVSGSGEASPSLLFSWAPDGQRLATYTRTEPGHLTFVGLDGSTVGTVALPEGAGGQEAYGAAMLPWSADGGWIAVRDCLAPDCSGHLQYLWVAVDGSGSRPLVDGSLAARVETSHQYLTLAPDGRAALNQWPGRVEIVSPDGSTLQEVILPTDLNPEDGSDALAWSPSGDRLAILERTADQQASQLVLVDRDLAVHVVARSPLDLVQGFRWTPDGAGFVYEAVASDGTMSLWSLPAGGGTATRLVDRVDGPFDVAGSTH